MDINTDYSYYNSSYYTAQAPKKQRESLLSLIDTDKDNSLSTDELSAFAAEHNAKTGSSIDTSLIMSKYDSDGDGLLDENEQETLKSEKALGQLMAGGHANRMRIMDEPPPASPFSEVDKDGDGSWNTDELTTFINLFNEAAGGSLDLESTLEKYDTDGDGSLSQSEQAEMIKDMTPPPASSTGTFDDDNDKKIREKLDDILQLMEETFAKKQEDKTLTEDTASKAKEITQAFINHLSQSIGNYEKSFLFEKTMSASVQYGA